LAIGRASAMTFACAIRPAPRGYTLTINFLTELIRWAGTTTHFPAFHDEPLAREQSLQAAYDGGWLTACQLRAQSRTRMRYWRA